MIKQIILGLGLGIIAMLITFQHDSRIHFLLQQQFKTAFEQSLDCTVAGDVESLNFFFPRLTLHSVRVCSRDKADTWHWSAQRYTATFSWWHFLTRGLLDLHVSLEKVRICSSYDSNGFTITPHIKQMITGPVLIPLVLKEIILDDAQCSIHDTLKAVDYTVQWRSNTTCSAGMLHTTFDLLQAGVTQHNHSYLSDMRGTFSVTIPEKERVSAHVQCQARIQQQHEEPFTCFASGTWQDGKGIFAVRTDREAMQVEKITVTIADDQSVHGDVQGSLPLSFLVPFLTHEKLPLAGIASFTAHTELRNGMWGNSTFAIHGDQLMYNDYSLIEQLQAQVHQRDNRWQITATGRSLNNSFTTVGSWDNNNSGSFEIHNNDSVALVGGAVAAPQSLKCAISVHEDGRIKGDFEGNIQVRDQSSHAVHGSFDYKQEQLYVHGMYNNYSYAMHTHGRPFGMNHSFTCTDHEGKVIIESKGQSDAQGKPTVKAECDFSFMRAMLAAQTGMQIPGTGIVTITGYQRDDNRYAVQLQLQQGTLRIPETYTVIHAIDLESTIDAVAQKMNIDHAHITLNKGTITVDHAVLAAHDGALEHAYVPFIADNCVFTLTKDMFAVISGALNFSYHQSEDPLLAGHIIIDRSQVKENIFSSALYTQLMSTSGAGTLPALQLNLTVETRDPLRIKTNFLQTSAQASLQVEQSIKNPLLSGSLICKEGVLQFPYKPLYISKAAIQFPKEHADDPLIELIARNTIKNYEITLAITGSLKDHHITLESTPSLTENQIISLLLVGSQEESLNTIIPALVMDNLKTLLFESEHSPVKLTGYFKNLLTPLKKVRLVPRFADQTGRGGLRGAIEVDVNERTRALIQKNFSLTEDTRLELEYQLSDDVTIRGIRDERRDVNAEVEMRWKF